MKHWFATPVLFLTCLFLISTSLLSQELRVTYSCDRCKVSNVLQELSQQHRLIFAYEDQLLADLGTTVKAVDLPLSQILEQVLRPHDLVANQIDQGKYTIIRARTLSMARVSDVRTLRGVVIQRDSGEPLPFATIRLSQQRGISANEAGSFLLQISAPFPDSLTVTYLGYESTSVPCAYDQEMVLTLVPNAPSLDDILITDAVRQTLRIQDAGGFIEMDPGRLHLLSGLGEGDLLRGLQLLPGLTAANERATGLYVRGGTPAENLVLFDGITVYQPGHFFGVLSAFNPESMKDVRLYRSGIGARYGGRTAAVIDITGKPGRVSKPRVGASANLMNAQAFVEIPWAGDKGGLLIAARRSYTDVAPSVFFRRIFDNRFQEGAIYFYGQQSQQAASNVKVDPRLHYYDINAKWLYRPNDRDLISVTAIKSGDELRYDLDRTLDNSPRLMTFDRLRMINDGVASTFARQWNPQHYTRFNTAYSGYRNTYQYSYLLSANGFSYRSDLRRSQQLQDFSTRLEHSWFSGKFWRLSGGIHQTILRLQDVQSQDDSQTDLVEELSDAGQLLHALFVESSYGGPKHGFEAGLRQHLLGDSLKSFFEPRLMAYTLLGKDLRLQANAGRYHQFLNYVSIYNGLEAGEDYWALASETEIPVLRSDMASLSAAWNQGPFLLQVEAYRKQMSGVLASDISYDPNFNETDLREQLVDGVGKVAGLELMLQKKSGRYTGWIAYTYSRVLQRFNESNEGRFTPSAFDRPHQLSVVNQYMNGPWEVSATWILASGIPYTPATSVTSIQLPSGNYLYFLDFGDRNSERLPAYHRADLTATYRFNLSQGKLRAGISVFNAYGRANIGNRVYAVNRPINPGDQASILVLDKPLLGFTPNVFLAWEW